MERGHSYTPRLCDTPHVLKYDNIPGLFRIWACVHCDYAVEDQPIPEVEDAGDLVRRANLYPEAVAAVRDSVTPE